MTNKNAKFITGIFGHCEETFPNGKSDVALSVFPLCHCEEPRLYRGDVAISGWLGKALRLLRSARNDRWGKVAMTGGGEFAMTGGGEAVARVLTEIAVPLGVK